MRQFLDKGDGGLVRGGAVVVKVRHLEHEAADCIVEVHGNGITAGGDGKGGAWQAMCLPV
jgi:hypothetical protein